jgi:hypothetical protein
VDGLGPPGMHIYRMVMIHGAYWLGVKKNFAFDLWQRLIIMGLSKTIIHTCNV